MKYILLSIIQTLSAEGSSTTQEHMVLDSPMACKQMQQIMIPTPTSSTDTTVIKVSKSSFLGQSFETTHTLICSPQG